MTGTVTPRRHDRAGRDQVADEINYDDLDLLEPGVADDWSRQGSTRLSGPQHALTIARLLAEAERTLEDLAGLTGLGARSVRRYVYALQLAGLDILVRRPRQYYLPTTYRLDRRSWHGLLYLPRD